MSLFCVKNDRDTAIIRQEPWLYQPNVPPFSSKKDYVAWRNNASTNHLQYTGVEGLNPDVRSNKDTNPVRRLHALIADYDVPITAEMEQTIEKVAPSGLMPTWMSSTFSGGRRLVWLFDEPVLFDGSLWKKFWAIASRELRVSKLLPGLDEEGCKFLYHVYDVGTNWANLSKRLIPAAVVTSWIVEAAREYRLSGAVAIPLPDVQAEIEKRFPGVWRGDFIVGARGPVFWEGKSNTTSAVVTADGMIAFSSDRLFHSWVEILGEAFVRDYRADKISSAVTETYFDGTKTKYYLKSDGKWDAWSKENFVLRLKSLGFSCKKEHDALSEGEEAELFIQTRHRIDGVIPSLFVPQDVISYGGKKYLNGCSVKVVQPHAESQEWGANFPWLATFFDLRFSDVEKPIFLAWWKRFYGSALAGSLLKGQAVFVVGDTGTGKTLLSHVIVGGSVGGAADASTHLVNRSEFNSELFEVALRCVDDGEVASDTISHQKFSEAVKRQVANPTMVYRRMYQNPQSVIYNGRLFITLNDDQHSLQLIPDLEISMEEKILAFRINDTYYAFPPRDELEATIRAELPFMLRWLIDWEVPEEVRGDNRLGVKPYINPGLRSMALHASGASDFLELVELWIQRSDARQRFGDEWEGSASSWMAEVSGDERLRQMVGKYTVKQLGRKFVAASRIPDSGISPTPRTKHKGSGMVYKVKLAVPAG